MTPEVEKFIFKRLEGVGSDKITYDTFSRIALATGMAFSLSNEEASFLVQQILKDKNITVGTQEWTDPPPKGQWPYQERRVPFSGNTPGGLYEPKSSLGTGSWVKVKPDTWRAEFEGIIKAINSDKTLNIYDPNADHLYESIDAALIDIPTAKGRPLAPSQYSRVGDDSWWGKSDVGDPNSKREYPGLWMMPKGHEQQYVANPPSVWHELRKEAEEKKKVCAWCNKVIKEGTEPASHTICPDCSKKELEKRKQRVSDDVLHSNLLEKIVKEYNEEVAIEVDKYLCGEIKEPSRELYSVLTKIGIARLA